MKAKKVIALVMCAAMVAGMSASSVMAADMPEQFKDCLLYTSPSPRDTR